MDERRQMIKDGGIMGVRELYEQTEGCRLGCIPGMVYSCKAQKNERERVGGI